MIGFTTPVLRRRTAGMYDGRGLWVLAAPVETTIACTVVPVDGAERDLRAEGIRRVSGYRAFTRERLRGVPDTDGEGADELFINGVYLRVTKVEQWSGPLGTFYACDLEAST